MSKENKDKTALSIPKVKTVAGYKIKKQPLGAYLALLDRVKDLPEDFAKKCFPGKTPEETWNALTRIDGDGFFAVAGNLITAAPAYVFDVVAEMIDADKDAFLWDNNVGPAELLDMIEAIIEVNGLGEFWAAANALTAKILRLTPTIRTPGSGSNG